MEFQFYQLSKDESGLDWQIVLYPEVIEVEVGLDKPNAEKELRQVHAKHFAPHFPSDDGQLILLNRSIGIVAVERRNETKNRELIFCW